MGEQRVQRRLAAILAADVVGYSRLTGADEEGTIARLRALRRELIDPTIAEHGARIVKTTGDGILIEFASVVDAVRCAVVVQRGMATRNTDVPSDRRIEFRVGIHVGDVVIEGDDLLGDGVNIAARLEGLAQPGGVCLSEDGYRQVRDRVAIAFVDDGERQLKNIARPVRVYRLVDDAMITPATAPPLPDKPSIAVLPFTNMSGDPEQQYFADGMVEEITTALSRTHWLFVIARNSSFAYKGKAVDIKLVGRELGVHYVLEGSVRKSSNRVRISCQLIDTITGAHLWADRYEGGVEDVFDLQDQVTASVVGAIEPQLRGAELGRSRRKPTESLTAYDYVLRGLFCYYVPTRQSNDEALVYFYKAIALDAVYSSAYGNAATCFVQRKHSGWLTDRVSDTAEGVRVAKLAAATGSDDAGALGSAGVALATLAGEIDAGVTLIDQALSLNPNGARLWFGSGLVRIALGEADRALEHIARAVRLSPRDPYAYVFNAAAALAYFAAGRYTEAVRDADKALSIQPVYPPALRTKAAALALDGRIDAAQDAVRRLRAVDPALTLADVSERVTWLRPPHMEQYVDGLRSGGLPHA